MVPSPLLAAIGIGGMLAFGGALYALFDNAGVSEPSTLSSDSGCASSRLSMRSDFVPAREPDGTYAIGLVDGERFPVEKTVGIWRARLAAENATFSHAAPEGVPAPPDATWTDVHHLGWCHTRPDRAWFVAKGSGTLTVQLWQGEDEGFRVG